MSPERLPQDGAQKTSKQSQQKARYSGRNAPALSQAIEAGASVAPGHLRKAPPTGLRFVTIFLPEDACFPATGKREYLFSLWSFTQALGTMFV